MMVYGDPSFTQPLPFMQRKLQQRLAEITACPSLDGLRTLLIQAGQFEQANADLSLPRALIGEIQHATDCAAAAFVSFWKDESDHGKVQKSLAQMTWRLEGLETPALEAFVKVPEGFAFYTLYPEQYCAAAERWLTDHGAAACVAPLVIGVRSIGTTLSAVVSATLAHGGLSVQRLTVRPNGHPLSRTVEFEALQLNDSTLALIVDEGPGLSGSSMVAAAKALAAGGVQRQRISFLPGHGAGPGPEASPEVRSWWTNTRQYSVALSDLRWCGKPLPECLAAHTFDLNCAGSASEFSPPAPEDFSGGQWRRRAFGRSNCWPAITASFERTKYLCRTEDRVPVLWKFAGLDVGPSGLTSAEENQRRLNKLAEQGWTPPPLRQACGFVALPWLDWAPLSRLAVDRQLLLRMTGYLGACSGQPLSGKETEQALMRLAQMLYVNTRESLGEPLAQHTAPLCEAAYDLRHTLAAMRRSGDGRMAPHEWLRQPSGRILKLDCGGHEREHTLVGSQPIAWDIAGVMVEWALDEYACATFLAQCRASGVNLPRPLLDFYRAAYAAFRLGVCTLGVLSNVVDEQPRLLKACEFYRSQLPGLMKGSLAVAG